MRATAKRPDGFRPVEIQDTGISVNPESAIANATAMRVVLLYMLAEAFDLRSEEQVWAGWALDDACSSLIDHKPHTVPLSVRQEMLNGTYSRMLELRAKPGPLRNMNVYDTRVVHADAGEWADALVAPIQASYVLPPFKEIEIRALLVTLLLDLGIDNPTNPRGANHLPTELRHKVLAERARS